MEVAEIRAKLIQVLQDKKQLQASAKATFKQFDADKNGTLDLVETRKLIERMIGNMHLPPINEATMVKMISKYDTDGDKSRLTLAEFTTLYEGILQSVRDKYYPTRKVVVRRKYFVGYQSLDAKRRITDLFSFDKKLGAGSFGEVHLVTEKSSKQVRVCKTINKDRSDLPSEQIAAEIEIMKALDHPNIIKIFEVYDDYSNVYIIMEMCQGGELLARILDASTKGKALSEKQIAKIMQQLLEAIGYVHDKKIVHKDLKPENVMFQDETEDSALKVIDFGVAELFQRKDNLSNQAAGTLLYMAPEVFLLRLGLKADIWSVGIIFYVMLTSRLPFFGKSVAELKHKVLKTEPPYQSDCQGVSPMALDFLKLLLSKDPSRRPSAVDALRHPWFRNAPVDSKGIPPEFCNNLRRCMKQTGMKNAISNLLVHQLNVTGPQIREIIRNFRLLDSDANGVLSRAELLSGLTKCGMREWDVNRILNALDIDDSGVVNYTEFLAACYTWRESEINVVWTAFNKLDVTGDGRVSSNDFIRLLNGDTSQSQLVSTNEINKMMLEIDKNNDGFVEWDEFLAFVRS